MRVPCDAVLCYLLAAVVTINRGSKMANHRDAEQSLRLLKAFVGIEDSKTREIVIALAESAQRGARISATPIDEKASADLIKAIKQN